VVLGSRNVLFSDKRETIEASGAHMTHELSVQIREKPYKHGIV
jgi:hypothetical protein